MAENNTIHIINGRVPQWNLPQPVSESVYYVDGYIDPDYIV